MLCSLFAFIDDIFSIYFYMFSSGIHINIYKNVVSLWSEIEHLHYLKDAMRKTNLIVVSLK